MKLLKNFKRGQDRRSKISISLNEKIHYQGDKVAVDIITQTPPPNGVTIELQEFWYDKQKESVGLGNMQQFRSESVFTQDTSELSPGVGHLFSLTLQLPRNCRTSTRTSGWQIVAKAENQVATQVIEVIPAYEFMAIISVCERRMKFKEKQAARHWSESGYTYFRMIPPNILKSEIDSLTLAFSHTDNNIISVGMTIKLKEKSVEDYFQNMINPANIINNSFQIDPNQIFMEDGSPNAANIIKIITPLLQAGIKREN
jgi:hypothetical protein